MVSSVTPIQSHLSIRSSSTSLAEVSKSAVDILADCLREELTNHFWFGCAKRECAPANVSVEFSKLVIATRESG